jgi:hypothetical protein
LLTTIEAILLLQMLVKEQKARQILNELMQGMAPLVRVHANATQLVFDTLSLLLQILVPTLRPVSAKTDFCVVMCLDGTPVAVDIDEDVGNG